MLVQVRLGVSVVGVHEICLDSAMLDLLAVDLRQRLERQVHVGTVVYIHDLKHARCALIDRIHVTVEQCCLMHLLSADLCLEADPLQPEAFLESDLRDFVQLAVIEFTEECSLNLVDEFHLHDLRLLGDLKAFKKSITSTCFAIFLEVSLEHALNVFLAQLPRVDKAWNCIIQGEL